MNIVKYGNDSDEFHETSLLWDGKCPDKKWLIRGAVSSGIAARWRWAWRHGNPAPADRAEGLRAVGAREAAGGWWWESGGGVFDGVAMSKNLARRLRP